MPIAICVGHDAFGLSADSIVVGVATIICPSSQVGALTLSDNGSSSPHKLIGTVGETVASIAHTILITVLLVWVGCIGTVVHTVWDPILVIIPARV